MERLAELEFTAVEIDIHEGGTHLQPEDVLKNGDAAIAACSDLQRLRPVALSFAAPEDVKLYDKFDACSDWRRHSTLSHSWSKRPNWVLRSTVRLSV
jgi:hypothetical protein